MGKIISIKGRRVIDSRGEWTLEVTAKLDSGLEASASVPRGKSRGSFEARCVSPEKAVKNVSRIISPALKGLDPKNQKKIDEILIKTDGTASKSKLGANATLGTSTACARAAAMELGVPLWRHLRRLSETKIVAKNPRLFINVINGGLHAGNNLKFQEYLIIPKAETLKEAIEAGIALYQNIKEHLIKLYGPNAANIGDEGGFAPDFKNDIEPFQIITRVAGWAGFKNKIDLGLDAAASNVKMKSSNLFSVYLQLKKEFGIFYLEDPFSENDFRSFSQLLSELKKNTLIAGDDLTATNVQRMADAKKYNSVNAVIVKPNQIGTLSETFEAIRSARQWKWSVIVSHRSGETNDDFIADLAYGVGADGIKLGAPARGERIAKYNRLLEIEEGR